MFRRFRHRRKSMGIAATATINNGAASEKQLDVTKRSWLDFFKRGRRKRKVQEGHSTVNEAGTTPRDDHEKKASTTTSAAQETDVASDTNAAAPVSPPPTQLTDDDVQQLFSGAPQFSASITEGQILVSASHPWDIDLQTREASDSMLIPHAAFNGATLRSCLPIHEPGATSSHHAMTYDIGVLEQPSMLASTGHEPGTVGLEFFLQEPEADILNSHADDHDDPGEVFENFSNFELLESQPEKLGIRKFDFATVAERLVELSTVYESTGEHGQGFNILNHTSSGDLYAALFGKILTPPKYDGSTPDPTGLKVQIEALLRILNLKRVWYNFSTVE